jgi:predicted amidophosphoribosyltransferase
MYWLKARLKGTNPSAVLAQTVAKSLGIPCEQGHLRRLRWTPSQTRLGLRQRFRNVQGAFQTPRERESTPAVLLVDDVLTSGATAHACALALRAAGVNQVFVLTAARAPSP